jgi:hypothetical protein
MQQTPSTAIGGRYIFQEKLGEGFDTADLQEAKVLLEELQA